MSRKRAAHKHKQRAHASAAGKGGSTQNKPARRAKRPLMLLGVVAGAVALGAVALVAFRPTAAVVDHREQTVVERGAELFDWNCAICHGPGGRGESAMAVGGGKKPTGGYWAPALNGTAHAWHHPPEQIFNVVKYGSSLEGSAMTGFEGRLSDEEIHAIMAYMESLWPAQIRVPYRQRHGVVHEVR